MMAKRTLSVRLVTLGGVVALAAAALVGPVAIIGAGQAAAAGTITQISPTTGSTKFGTAFSAQLETMGNLGQVTFATDSVTNWGTVSSTGAVSAAATAVPGTYFLFGYDFDAFGGVGQWQFTLTVTSPS